MRGIGDDEQLTNNIAASSIIICLIPSLIFVVSAANIQKIPHTITIRGILYDNLGESVYFQ